MSTGKVINLTKAVEGDAPQQIDVFNALQQMEQQINQIDMQIRQQKNQYVSAYVNLATQVALEKFKQGSSPDDALYAGKSFAEAIRKTLQEKEGSYEKLLRDEAPADATLLEQLESIKTQKAKLEEIIKELQDKAALITNGGGIEQEVTTPNPV